MLEDTIDKGRRCREFVLYLNFVFVFVNITRRRGKLSRRDNAIFLHEVALRARQLPHSLSC